MPEDNAPVETPENTAPVENQTETPVNADTETPVETKTAVETPEDKTEPSEQDKRSKAKAEAFQTRIDQLTKARREAEREAAELKIRLAAAEAKKGDGEKPAPEAKAEPQADIESLVEKRAAEKLAAERYQARVNNWAQAGNSEFKDFTERCNTVANLGAGDRPDFMQVVTDPGIIPDGHKLVAALADDPAEAQRILAMPTVAMAAELVRYANKIGQPKGKAISGAPAPIKPIDGTAKASDEPSPDDSEEEWFAKRAKQVAQKRQGARF